VSPLPPVTLLCESLQPSVTILLIGPAAGAVLHIKHQGLQIGGGAIGHTAPAGRDSLSRSSLTSLALARLRHDRGYLTCRGDTVAERRKPVVAGELAVRWERQDAVLIMWLSGALDQATVTLLDRELDGQAIGLMGLVVDLTGLVFIDAPGLDALVGIHWRAAKRGDRLSFRHGPHVAQRPVELTRTVRLRSR
jgi:anti-anti-sigma regulatory factor